MLGLLGWAFYFLRVTQVETRVADTLQVEVDRMRGLENRIASLRKESAALDAETTPLLRAINDRGAWSRIFDDLNARLPKENIWITELAPTSGGKILGGAGRPGSTPSATTHAHSGRAVQKSPISMAFS